MATLVGYTQVQYSGIWSLSGQANAKAAGTWPTQPVLGLYSWGKNDYGQLGIGNITNYSSPKHVGSLTNWLSVTAGLYSSYGLKTDGTLWAWGYNAQGQLGLGNTTAYSSPKQVGALTNWSSVTSGYAYAHAIKTDGTLWAWGYNARGSLGTGNIDPYSSPVQIGTLTNWLKVSASGYACMLAIKTDGTLWSWGINNYGQLGTGNITYRNSPVQVGALTTWASLNAGVSTTFSFAIKTDGTLWAWGINNYGQLGLNSSTYAYSSPKQVGSLTNWASIKSTNNSVSAIRTDGTLWSWGRNNVGQLGLGNVTNYSSPKQVGSLTNWLSMAAGGYYTNVTALKTDGTLWTWGNNAYGGLGIGNITNYSSPKQVGSLTTWSAAANGIYGALGIAVA